MILLINSKFIGYEHLYVVIFQCAKFVVAGAAAYYPEKEGVYV
jgi:hypothetical protein